MSFIHSRIAPPSFADGPSSATAHARQRNTIRRYTREEQVSMWKRLSVRFRTLLGFAPTHQLAHLALPSSSLTESTRLRGIYSFYPANPWIPTSRPDSWYRKAMHAPPPLLIKPHISFDRYMHKEVSTRRRHHPQAKGSVDKKIRNPLKRHSLEKHADINPPPRHNRPNQYIPPKTQTPTSSAPPQS